MPLGKKVTSYLKNSLEYGRLAKVEFSKSEKFYLLPYNMIVNGLLDKEVTQQLLSDLKERDRNAYKEGSPVPVVISLKTLLCSFGTGKHQGVLLLTALMNHQGELEYDPQKNFSWIPFDRLRMDHARELDVMIGDLSTLRKFQLKEGKSLESKIESWNDYISYAENMYEAVYDKKQAANATTGCLYEIETGSCYIKYHDDFDASTPIIALYNHLLGKTDTPALYDTMMNSEGIRQTDDSEIESHLENNMITACGHVSQRFHLAPSQRKAIHGFNQLKKGNVLAISGPPGTGKTTTLQDIVANLITQHALQNKPPPIIVGMSTNNQAVTNIIDSFGNITSENPGILDQRWLPHIKISYDSKGREVSRTIKGSLPGLATYYPSGGKIREAKSKGYLFDLVHRGKEGTYSLYSSESYYEEAIQYYYKMASNFFAAELHDLNLIEKKLKDRLKQINKARIKLIKEYNRLRSLTLNEEDCRNELHQAESSKAQLENEYEHYQERLRFWALLEEKHRSKLFFIKRKQDNIIAANKGIDEEIVTQCKTLSEVCDVYRDTLRRQEKSRVKAQNDVVYLHSALRQKKILVKQCVRIIDTLVKHCRLTDSQAKKLRSVVKQDTLSLSNLDCILDTTIRNTEFWLAIHSYECAWLLACEHGKIIDSSNRYKSTKEVREAYWNQAPCITPCFVMTAYMLPRVFKCFTKGECEKFDLERIDLLIVDEAGQVDVPVGLASFGMAKRAVVVGDTKQLDPIWTFDEESDEEVAKNALCTSNEWRMLRTAGCTASPNSSLMKLAATVSPWRYSEEEGGLFLSEHYRCSPEIIAYCNNLLYKGLLEPQRPPANKDEKNPLRGIYKPLLYRVVDDSKSTTIGSSRNNLAEAQAITQWIISNFDLLKERYQDTCEDTELIGVVTPFSAQAKMITKVLTKKDPRVAQQITIGTAHRLQGAERPVILFSAVYGNTDDRSNFIEQTPKLMNVAVSRAKDMFMVFCSNKRVYESGEVLSTFFQLAQEDNVPSIIC